MIAKITKGRSAHALAKYLHGPGTREEHSYDGQAHGRVIASNLTRVGESQGAWARTMNRIIGRRHGGVSKPVYQVSLRNPKEDRVLSDLEWGVVAREWLGDMGAGDRPFVVVRHGVDHVHIVVSRVGFDQSLWNPRHDYHQAQEACRRAEKAHHLTPVVSGWDKRREAPAKEIVTQTEAALSERGKLSWKRYIRTHVDVVMRDPSTVTREVFEHRLKEARWPIQVRHSRAGELVYTVPTKKGMRSVSGRLLGSDYQAKDITDELERREGTISGASVTRERRNAPRARDNVRGNSSTEGLTRGARAVSEEITQATRAIERSVEEATLTPSERAARAAEARKRERAQQSGSYAARARRVQKRTSENIHIM